MNISIQKSKKNNLTTDWASIRLCKKLRKNENEGVNMSAFEVNYTTGYILTGTRHWTNLYWVIDIISSFPCQNMQFW